MPLPVIRGNIARRILVNYRVDADVLARLLPAPFEPKRHGGFGVAGICLIRLESLRPRWAPRIFGLGSENAAHRIAVQWNEGGRQREGVFIPRRDTSSWLNTWAGGRVFPGEHGHARFDIRESDEHFRITMTSDNGETRTHIVGHAVDTLPANSIFDSVAEASRFFEVGAVGYSPNHRTGRYDGVELHCFNWTVQPLEIETAASSFFDDPKRFPAGSVHLDHALLMRDIAHEWHLREPLAC